MRRIEAPRGESPVMNRRGINIAVQGEEIEFQARPFSRYKQLAVPTNPQARTAPHNTRLPMDRFHRLQEQRRFVVERNGKRIDPPRRDDPVTMGWLRSKLHPFTREGRGAFGDLNRQFSHPRDIFQRTHRTCRKAPGAVKPDADSKPAVLRVWNGRDRTGFAANGLCRAVQEPHMAVLGPGGCHAFRSEFGEFVLMRIRLCEHRVCILPDTPALFNSPLGFSQTIPYDVALCFLPDGRRVNGSSTRSRTPGCRLISWHRCWASANGRSRNTWPTW